MKVTAAVVDSVGSAFRLAEVALADPEPDEVLIRVAGAGLCHTDLAVRDGTIPSVFPIVLGHEGSGVVVAVGRDVTKVEPGDAVVLTFRSCGNCVGCAGAHPAYCQDFSALNFAGPRSSDQPWLSEAERPLAGGFFGQSSFASHAIAFERNVVKIAPGPDLLMLGPLGCGVQTGAGAVMNSLDLQPGASLLVLGGGSVGLSAVLAAVARGAGDILVSEPYLSRRELALALGATAALDPSADALDHAVRALLPKGVDNVLDTTGSTPLVESAIGCLARRGKLGYLGVPRDRNARFAVPMVPTMSAGISLHGIVAGDSDPDTFIPYLVELFRTGRFPLDKLVSVMPLADINAASDAQLAGQVVKVVLTPEAD